MSSILKGLSENKKDDKGFMPTPRQVPAPPGGHPVPPGYERVKSWGGAWELRKKTTEGEVVSMQARKTPLVIAGSPFDWNVYDLRNNKMVASVIGGDRSESKLYEIRINRNGMTNETRMPPTYVLTAGAHDNPPYKAYELVAPEGGFGKIEKSPGPGGTTKLRPDQDDVLRHVFKILGGGKYYGYDLNLVEEGLDQWELVEKALGAKIMEIDDAMELGYTDVDPEDSSSIVYLGSQKNEGYSAGASGGAGLGEKINTPGGMGQSYRKYKAGPSGVKKKKTETAIPMFTPETKMVNANDPGSDGWKVYKAKPSGILEGIIKEYDTKTIDSVVQRLPKGLTVNNFTSPAFKEFLYQKYYSKVKADWDKLYPFFAQEYKQKHGIKEYKQDPHRIVSGDTNFFDDMLLVIPKGLNANELYTQAFKEFLYKKFADREWTDFKKNRFTYWDAYQKLGGDKKDKKFFGLFDEETNENLLNTYGDQLGIDEELKCWKGYKRVSGTKAGEKGSCTKAESAIIKGLQAEDLNEYDVDSQRKIVFSKENPPDLYYLYQQFIQRMLDPENTVDPYDWIEQVNKHYGLNYTWKDYQKRGHNDHTNNWQKIIDRYVLGKNLNEEILEEGMLQKLAGLALGTVLALGPQIGQADTVYSYLPADGIAMKSTINTNRIPADAKVVFAIDTDTNAVTMIKGGTKGQEVKPDPTAVQQGQQQVDQTSQGAETKQGIQTEGNAVIFTGYSVDDIKEKIMDRMLAKDADWNFDDTGKNLIATMYNAEGKNFGALLYKSLFGPQIGASMEIQVKYIFITKGNQVKVIPQATAVITNAFGKKESSAWNTKDVVKSLQTLF